MWYLDCYTDWDGLHGTFPVNTYCHPHLDRVVREISKVLENPQSGIVRVGVSRLSRGCGPVRLEDDK